jgi:hypothetical protein
MMRTGRVLLFSSLCISLPLVTFVPTALALQAQVNPLAQEMVEFKERVDGCPKLRSAVTQKYPEVKETGDPAKISEREKNLGMGIAMARKHAKARDVFGPKMSRYLLEIPEDDWNSRSAADRRAIFAEIPPGLVLKVNQVYPTNLPLVSVPAKLLARLPSLPEELEYHLIDWRLLLRDRDVNLIVDVLVGVEPKRAQ